jgi:hypothetical protein
MLTAQTEELILRLKIGKFEPADVQALEASAHEFLADLDSVYQCRFQERRLRNKWEVGVARSLRFEIVSLSAKGAFFPILVMVPVFRNCFFLSGDADTVTGIGVATRLLVRPIRKPFRGVALTTGRGFKLDRAPDGWDLKPLATRTVKLTNEFLQKRGWRFDSLQPFAPKP